MPKPEKVQAVAEIKARLEQARAVFLAEYAGLSVQEQQTLRRSLRDGGAEFKVVKMTLARRAAADLDIDTLDDLLLGPTGLAFADDDAVTAAKALRDFADDHDAFTIKGGLLGRDFLTPERIDDLAKIESRQVLLARLAGAMQAPLSNLAGLLAALPRGLATAMQQLIEKLPPEEPAAAASEEEADAIGEPERTADAEPEIEPENAAGPEREPEPKAESELEVADERSAGEQESVPRESSDTSAGQSAEEGQDVNDDDKPAAAAEEE